MATDQEEIDANAFAAALVMAAGWVRAAFETVAHNTAINSEDELAEVLAARFGVRRQALLFRLITLGDRSRRAAGCLCGCHPRRGSCRGHKSARHRYDERRDGHSL